MKIVMFCMIKINFYQNFSKGIIYLRSWVKIYNYNFFRKIKMFLEKIKDVRNKKEVG